MTPCRLRDEKLYKLTNIMLLYWEWINRSRFCCCRHQYSIIFLYFFRSNEGDNSSLFSSCSSVQYAYHFYIAFMLWGIYDIYSHSMSSSSSFPHRLLHLLERSLPYLILASSICLINQMNTAFVYLSVEKLVDKQICIYIILIRSTMFLFHLFDLK